MPSTSAQSDRPEPPALTGWLYDGVTSDRRAVTVAIDGDMLRIVDGEGAVDTVGFGDLVPLGDHARIVFGRVGREGWRLRLDPLPAEIAARLPRQERRCGILDRFPIVLVLIVAALASVVGLVALMQGAAFAARLVPMSWEVALGDALVGDLGGSACNAPAGRAALDRLVARLALDTPVKVRIVDLDIENAVAMPGRHIVVFRGLLTNAHSPDEIAGVIGHEAGHVANRDVMTGLLRSFGLSVLIGGVDGGAMTASLLASRYSRAAEAAADDYAIHALDAARVTPAATAAFFDRLAKSEGGDAFATRAASYFASHPLSADRRRAFLASAREAGRYTPALDAPDWRDLRAICGK